MSTRIAHKVVVKPMADGTLKEYEYEYEVPRKTGIPGRKTLFYKKQLKEANVTEEEAKQLVEYLNSLRQ